MKHALADPLRALESIGYYPSALGLLSDSLEAISRLYKSKRVSFAEDEPGAALMR